MTVCPSVGFSTMPFTIFYTLTKNSSILVRLRPLKLRTMHFLIETAYSIIRLPPLTAQSTPDSEFQQAFLMETKRDSLVVSMTLTYLSSTWRSSRLIAKSAFPSESSRHQVVKSER